MFLSGIFVLHKLSSFAKSFITKLQRITKRETQKGRRKTCLCGKQYIII